MANSTVAFGFRPLGKLGGNPAAGGQDQYEIVDNYSSSIFQGDLVKLNVTGGVIVVDTSALTSVFGVFNGCLIESDPSTKKPTWRNFYKQTDVTQGNIYAYVVNDPNQLYLVKSTGTALGNTAVGVTFKQVYAAGNTNNGISGAYLDLGTSAAASGGQATVVNLSPFVGNEENVTNEDYIVRLSKGTQLL
jgi:hypothetical protein